MRYFRKASPFILVFLLGFFMAGHLPMPWGLGSGGFSEKPFGLFRQTVSWIRNGYVEDVPLEKLIAGAIGGLMKTLDPYSQYLGREAYEDLKTETDGKFGGIGVEVTVKNGLLSVIAPLDGTPAARAGLRPGDVILKIDGFPMKDAALSEAVRKLRGEPGTTTRLTLMREGENQWLEIPVRRELVKIHSIQETKFLEGSIGYIRLAAFQDQTPRDLLEALRTLESGGLRALILDLRNNPGGLFLAAVKSAELFIPEGKTIVSTKGRNVLKNVTFTSRSKAPHRIRLIVVLVNQGSASGSEILAGALKDHGLAVVVGKKTFGKGSIQSLVPLGDGTAIRLTTSRYYTPSGQIIQEAGVTPDVTVDLPETKDPKDVILEKGLELARAGIEAQPVPSGS